MGSFADYWPTFSILGDAALNMVSILRWDDDAVRASELPILSSTGCEIADVPAHFPCYGLSCRSAGMNSQIQRD